MSDHLLWVALVLEQVGPSAHLLLLLAVGIIERPRLVDIVQYR